MRHPKVRYPSDILHAQVQTLLYQKVQEADIRHSRQKTESHHVRNMHLERACWLENQKFRFLAPHHHDAQRGDTRAS